MNLNYILEIIGTIAFAISGVLVAVKYDCDLLGIFVLAVVTSVGGGAIRDLLIGNIPPKMFVDPTFVIVAAITALCAFLFIKFFKMNERKSKKLKQLSHLYVLCDAIGLGIFTVVGVDVCLGTPFGDNAFLAIFVGVLTGVGGGLTRDVLVNRRPIVLRKEIYATASIVGAVVYYYFHNVIPISLTAALAMMIVIFVRMIAVKRNLNLPKLSSNTSDENE